MKQSSNLEVRLFENSKARTAESLTANSANINPAGSKVVFGDSAVPSVATATVIDAAVIQSTPL